MKSCIKRKSTNVIVYEANHEINDEMKNEIAEKYGGTNNDYEIVIDLVLTDDEKKAKLRPIRNSLLDEADIRYCNADKWEIMSSDTKTAWRTWKQNMKDWIGIDLDFGTFPSIPE